jgi:hypothetical protein
VQPYLTPERLRTMRAGSLFTAYSDLELADLIADASAIADAYCNLAMTPEPGSLRGGTVVDEEHNWPYPHYAWEMGTKRVYLFNQPVREVTNFKLLVAAGATASIPTNSLVVNHTERWVEVTSLAIASSSGLFGVTGWVVPIGGLADPMAQISYSYGRVITETLERLYPITNDEKRIFQAGNGFWIVDVDHEVTVTVDDLEADPDDYEVDTDVGRITFDADTTGVVRATYSHALDRNVPSAVGLIMEHLHGAAKARARGLTGGVHRVKVGEISIDRGMSARQAGGLLETAIPEAALMLSGHKVFWMA